MHHGRCISLLKALRLLTLKAAKVNILDKKNSQESIILKLTEANHIIVNFSYKSEFSTCSIYRDFF